MPDPAPSPVRFRRGPAVWVGLIAGAVLLIVILAVAMGRPPRAVGEQGVVWALNVPGARNAPGAPNAPGASNRPGPRPPNSPERSASSAPAAPAVNSPGVKAPEKVDPNQLPPEHPEIPVATGPQLSLQWLGHSCFYLHSPGQATVVMDPFDPKSTGLPAPDTGAHLVTVSADGPDHSFTRAIHAFSGEKREVLRGRGAQLKDLKVTPVELEPGRFAYVFETAGLRVAHLGDLTRPPGPDRLRQLGKVDILLVPAGGEGISPKDAAAVAKAVAPRVVIPMAYSTVTMEGPESRLKPVDEFVAATPFAVTGQNLDTMLIGPAELPPSTEIYTLKLRR